MSTRWDGQSKGGTWGYRFFVLMMTLLGLRFTYVFLHFVVFYYWVTARQSNHSLKFLYRKRLKYSYWSSKGLIYKNYYRKGQILIDQFMMMYKKKTCFTYTEEGESLIVDSIQQGGRGLILLGSHVGAWNLAAYFLKLQKLKVNIVMYENERQAVKRVMGTLSDQINIIPLTEGMEFMLAVKLALQNNEIVCLNADRYLDKKHVVACDFLGKKAYFPTGVFQMVSLLKVPVAYISGVKRGTKQYHFTCTILDALAKPEDLAQAYAAQLEITTRREPEQWFNYYDYWSED